MALVEIREITETEAERLADARRWLKDHRRHSLPVNNLNALAELDRVERSIRKEDPSGLPARCDVCRRRLPMISRDEKRHPKCVAP